MREGGEMRRFLVLYNPGSGTDSGRAIAESFKEIVKGDNASHHVYLHSFDEKTAKEPLREKAEANQIDTLVIVGGDGTIRHVVQTFRDCLADYKIGLLPGGTVNNFMRSLDLPLDIGEASRVILGDETQAVDYGVVNGEVLISTLTIGILADTAADITQKEKQKYGPFLFVKRFIDLLRKRKRYNLNVVTDETTWHGKSQLLSINMTHSVGGFTRYDRLARPDDGILHMTIMPKLNIWELIRYSPKILQGRLYDLPQIEYLTARSVRITAQEINVGTRIDGDPSMDLPVEMEVIPRGLQILIKK